MTMQSLPTLYELAKQSLLQSKDIACTALQNLPIRIYHQMFMEDFITGNNEVLKVMVQAWPFPCFPLKTLLDMKPPPKDAHTEFERERSHTREKRETLNALLDGIDIQLSQKVQHSSWKLKVLEWRDLHRDYWTLGPTAMTAAQLTDARYQETGKPGLDKMPMLKVVTNSCCEFSSTDELLVSLTRWAKSKKASVHLYHEKMMVPSCAITKTLKFLRDLQLDYIHELILLSGWTPKNLNIFFCHLKKMAKLHTFCFRCVREELFTSPSKSGWYSRLYAFHLGQMQSLRELHIHGVFFLPGTLHKIISNKTLEALSLISSHLKKADLKHLSQWASTSQLKSLTLRGISLSSFQPETLQVLLCNLASTVENLALEECGITDSLLLAILPALSRCSQLKTFSCYGNCFSLEILLVLLRLTAGLSHLTQGLYPAPRESYSSFGPETGLVPSDQFFQVFVVLAEFLKGIRPSLRVKICTGYCDECTLCELYRLAPSGDWEIRQEYYYPNPTVWNYCFKHNQDVHMIDTKIIPKTFL